jgi:hypothetical protein
MQASFKSRSTTSRRSCISRGLVRCGFTRPCYSKSVQASVCAVEKERFGMEHSRYEVIPLLDLPPELFANVYRGIRVPPNSPSGGP